MADKDKLAQGRRVFTLAQDAETDNRKCYEDDVSFARHEEQWPSEILKQREDEGRPTLTISKMNSFIRQVVNDARQNKPSIKVHPADSGADPETAEVINGLIRNIEYTSNADTAYDTAMECAVSGGYGYWRIGLDYAYEDSFDMDLSIERIANPLSVYGDPYSTAADSSDWMDAFVVDVMSKDQFTAKHGKTKTVQDWDDSAWGEEGWRVGNDVTVAEWWHREQAEIKVQQFRNVQTREILTYTEDAIARTPEVQAAIASGSDSGGTAGLVFVRERMAKTYRVTQNTMTGAEVLSEVKWAGCYIPIVPVYGDEYNIKGKRYFRSLIHSAKDAQRQFNYWRSSATELVALAPRVPWIGRKGAFDTDQERWNTANTQSHAYLEYDGAEAPQRISLDSGPAAGALQEALNASDDMKAVMGIYDASLGARSNETSGRAIMARQREGDVSTFHFVDNLNRAIRHTGRILIDLIPHVYSGERIIRVMGEDGTPENKPLNQQYPKTDPKTGQPVTQDGQPPAPDGSNVVMAMHDLSAGKYDLTVTTGPSFTTRREEAAFQMTEMMRALPASAPILGKHLAKNMDWPGADDIAEEFEALSQPPQIPPELQQQIEEGQQKLAEQEQTIQQMKADTTVDTEKAKAQLMLQKQKQDADLQMQREKMDAEYALEMQKIKQARDLKLIEMGMEENAPEANEDGTLKSRDETRSEALMQGLTMLGQLVAQEGHATRASLEQIAGVVSAPTELVKDRNGRTVGARKVVN
jgi:hypothetical protein